LGFAKQTLEVKIHARTATTKEQGNRYNSARHCFLRLPVPSSSMVFFSPLEPGDGTKPHRNCDAVSDIRDREIMLLAIILFFDGPGLYYFSI